MEGVVVVGVDELADVGTQVRGVLLDKDNLPHQIHRREIVLTC